MNRARVPLARGRWTRANQTVCPRRELNQPSAVSNFGYLLLASRIPIVFPRIPEIADGRIRPQILGLWLSSGTAVRRSIERVARVGQDLAAVSAVAGKLLAPFPVPCRIS